MSKTSRKNFSEELKKKIWKDFWTEIEKSKKSGRSDFLSKFLTEEEKSILEKRLAAVYFLKQGKSLRETAREADLTKKTVIFVKRGLKPLNYKKKVYSKSSKKSKHKIYPKSYGTGRRNFLKTD